MNPNNPLRQYFRQPSIYIRLPSKGNYYPAGAIEITESGEIPVYPMTAIDEITYRTPDALFNGEAVVKVIQSCVPNIKNGWAIPAMDVDTVLVAIRIASYGHNMEFTTVCPACSDITDRTVDLRSILDMMKTPDYTKSIRYGDMEIFFKPMSYKNLTDNNKMQYDEQKILQMMPDENTPDSEKAAALNSALQKITEITVQALAQSIASVKTPTAIVTEVEYIRELIQNCDRKFFNELRDHIINLKGEAEMKPLDMECVACNHKYKQTLTLDMTSFFEDAS